MAERCFIIKFEPMGRLVDGRLRETVLEVSARENLPIRSDCGGNGKCGKCLVIVDPAANATAVDSVELNSLPQEKLSENVRLACQTRILGPLTVTIPEQFMDSKVARGKSLAAVTYPLAPMVRRVFLPKAPFPSGQNPIADITHWFMGRLNEAAGVDVTMPDTVALRLISSPDTLQKDATVVVHKTHGATAVIEGNAPRSLGLAVDIGTTSLAAYLCDMQTGRVVASATATNPSGVSERMLSVALPMQTRVPETPGSSRNWWRKRFPFSPDSVSHRHPRSWKTLTK